MGLFLSTFENKRDKKGRVSVPASFRAALPLTLYQGIIVYRSHKFPALEACGMDRMESISQALDQMDVFSDAQDELATTIFADSHQLPLDADGRVSLPDDLLKHADITERVLFVGAGPIFRIWEPTAFADYQEKARLAVKEKGLTLRLPQKTGGSA